MTNEETCGACNGSRRMPRDPDIGTDQECFVCDGSGVIATNEAKAAPAVPQGWKSVLIPTEWTIGPNLFKDWCNQWFGPDADDEYLMRAAHALLGLAATPAAPSQERCCTCGYLTSEREHLGCLRKAAKDLDAATGGPYPSQEPVTDEVLESLRECVNSLWVIDSHVVEFDGTVHFGPYYDFSGLDGIDRHEFLAEHSCVVWPSGGKWSAYCTYDGTTWFELFDSADAAKEKCMGLLDRVMPAHPAMKARAIIAALREKQGGV